MPVNVLPEAVPWLRPFVAEVWLRRHGFDAIPVHVEFVMD